VRGCRARQCSLLCRARQDEHWRARTWRVSSQIGEVLCPAAKGFQCAVLFQLRRSCVWGTASRGCRASMLDTNTVNKRTSLPRTNSCARLSRETCRAKSERFFVPRQRDFSVLYSCSWDGLVSEGQRPSTAALQCWTRTRQTNEQLRGSRAQSIPSLTEFLTLHSASCASMCRCVFNESNTRVRISFNTVLTPFSGNYVDNKMFINKMGINE
jgi:hypothetical protein